jgi:hypothetical protein
MIHKIKEFIQEKVSCPWNKSISLGTENFPGEDDDEYPVDLKLKKENVKTYGRLQNSLKMLRQNAFNFLENVKVSKKSIWYYC